MKMKTRIAMAKAWRNKRWTPLKLWAMYVYWLLFYKWRGVEFNLPGPTSTTHPFGFREPIFPDGHCDDCIKQYSDVMFSEEARYYGQPAKLQIWTDSHTVEDEGFGEVEVTCANYSTVCFWDSKNKKTVPIRKEDFMRWFSFVRTTY